MTAAPSPAALALLIGASDADLFTVDELTELGAPGETTVRAMLAAAGLPTSGRCVRAYLRGWTEHAAFLRAGAALRGAA